MQKISFAKHNVAFRITKKKVLANWIIKIIKGYGFRLNNLSIIFCNDSFLFRLNKKYLNHSYFTDIITFDLKSAEKEIEAELYISIDRVRRNSVSFGINFNLELSRVLIHGVLHLLGFNDSTEFEKKTMRKKEDECLSLLQVSRGTNTQVRKIIVSRETKKTKN